MMLQLIFVLAAVMQITAALPAYKVPVALKPMLASHFCILPAEFVVKNFQVWTPAPGNNRTTFINFEYSDQDTWIDTKCHFNETSVNVGPKGLAPRYACDTNLVEFIWQNGTLTMIERACPLEDKYRPSEAAGSVTPNLKCYKSDLNSTVGEGSACASSPRVLSAVFTSLEPKPE